MKQNNFWLPIKTITKEANNICHSCSWRKSKTKKLNKFKSVYDRHPDKLPILKNYTIESIAIKPNGELTFSYVMLFRKNKRRFVRSLRI